VFIVVVFPHVARVVAPVRAVEALEAGAVSRGVFDPVTFPWRKKETYKLKYQFNFFTTKNIADISEKHTHTNKK
jgi:hypothetical protein